MMSEAEFLDLAWKSCTKRVLAMIGEYSKDWVPTGPSKATANAIAAQIRNMPVPPMMITVETLADIVSRKGPACNGIR